MTDVNAIRDAIAAIADTAHPPQRIRAAIDARSQARRGRRVVLRTTGAVAAAAAVGAGGVGIYRWARPGGPGFPDVGGGPGGGWTHAAPRWRPAWLPEGFGLTDLGAVVDGDTATVASRTWSQPQRAGEPLAAFVSVTTGWSDAYASREPVVGSRAVEVGGTPGELVDTESGVRVAWRPAGEPTLTVAVVTPERRDASDIALRVARSLRRDAGAVAVGPRPGWLPPEWAARPWMHGVAVLEGAWSQTVSVYTESQELNVTFGPSVVEPFPREFSTPVRVRGTEGRRSDSNVELFVPLPEGVNILANSGMTPHVDLVRVVDTLDLGPVPDMTWYGGR